MDDKNQMGQEVEGASGMEWKELWRLKTRGKLEWGRICVHSSMVEYDWVPTRASGICVGLHLAGWKFTF